MAFNRLLKKPQDIQFVMLNSFQHLEKAMGNETLKPVQGDRERKGLHLSSIFKMLKRRNREKDRGNNKTL
jgi:hypothetical protein